MKYFFICLLFTLPVIRVYAQPPHVVKYPLVKSEYDLRHKYSDDLFQLLIVSSAEQVHLQRIELENQDQHVTLLDNKAVDVFSSSATSEMEQRYHAIRFPMYKGMQGYRLILLREKDKDSLKNVSSLEQLRKFVVGQGTQWIETKLYEQAGFQVNSSRDYDHLFTMLARERFDLFPRSILEIWKEYDTYKSLGLAIDQHVLLYYPLAMYFYVRKEDKRTAQILEKGFQVAIDNGAFDALFNKHFGSFVLKMDKENRTLIELPNPFSSYQH